MKNEIRKNLNISLHFKELFQLLLSSPFNTQARVTLLYMLVPPKRLCTSLPEASLQGLTLLQEACNSFKASFGRKSGVGPRSNQRRAKMPLQEGVCCLQQSAVGRFPGWDQGCASCWGSSSIFTTVVTVKADPLSGFPLLGKEISVCCCVAGHETCWQCETGSDWEGLWTSAFEELLPWGL